MLRSLYRSCLQNRTTDKFESIVSIHADANIPLERIQHAKIDGPGVTLAYMADDKSHVRYNSIPHCTRLILINRKNMWNLCCDPFCWFSWIMQLPNTLLYPTFLRLRLRSLLQNPPLMYRHRQQSCRPTEGLLPTCNHLLHPSLTHIGPCLALHRVLEGLFHL